MELTIKNQTDSFTLAIEAIYGLRAVQHTRKENVVISKACRRYAYEHGINKSEISGWEWPYETR